MKHLKFILFFLVLCPNVFSQISESFEFLDHHLRSSYIGANKMMDDKIVYVSHNASVPLTTVNVVSEDGQVETIFEKDIVFCRSKLIELDDMSSFVILYSLSEYEQTTTGFYAIKIEENTFDIDSLYTIDTEFGDDFNWSEDIIQYGANDVIVDSLGRFVMLNNHSISTISESEIERFQMPTLVLSELYTNGHKDMFAFTNKELFYYDENGINRKFSVDKYIMDMKPYEDRNFILSEGQILIYDLLFENHLETIVVPNDLRNLDPVYFSEEGLYIASKDDISSYILFIKWSGEREIVLELDSEEETISNFDLLENGDFFISGHYGKAGFFNNIFFRYHSIEKENVYEKADVSFAELSIKRISGEFSDTQIDTSGNLISSGTFDYAIDYSFINNSDTPVFQVNAFSKNYLDDSNAKFHFDFFYGDSFDSRSSTVSYESSIYHSSEFDGKEQIPFYIPGANYKFNRRENSFVEFELAVDTDEVIYDERLRLYPNPSSALLNFQLESLVSATSVYDMDGKLVLHRYSQSGLRSVDISALSSGTYVIKLLTQDKSDKYFTSKFVKL